MGMVRLGSILLFVFLGLAWGLNGLSETAVSQAQPIQADPTDLPNIIFIVADALRGDHISASGYGRHTTPNLDSRIANQGIRFTDATTPSPWTYPTNAAMLTSHFPSSLDIDYADMNSQIPADEMMLAEYLHDAGYTTAGFVAAYYVWEIFGFDQGFDTYIHTQSGTGAEQVNQLAINWLDTFGSPTKDETSPLFLYLYYYDPHTPYDPPEPYDTLYDSTYTGTLTAEVYGHGHPVVGGEIVPTPRDIEHLIALYDGDISYWDFKLGEMLDHLESLGIMDNSIVVFTSDHGQMFGEHGKWVHRNSLYEEVLRVPFLLSYPGTLTAGTVITAPVHTLDITPTILDLIGLPVPEHMVGQSLATLAEGGSLPENRPIFAEMDKITDPNHPAAWIAPKVDLYSIKQDGWKLIHGDGSRADDALFEIQLNSLYETENVIAEQPAQSNLLFDLLINQLGLPTEFTYLPIID